MLYLEDKDFQVGIEKEKKYYELFTWAKPKTQQFRKGKGKELEKIWYVNISQ